MTTTSKLGTMFGVVDGSKPPQYQPANTFRAKAFRKATRLEAARQEGLALEAALKIERAQNDRLMELNRKMIQKLAAMGLKVKLDKGEITFEAIRAGEEAGVAN